MFMQMIGVDIFRAKLLSNASNIDMIYDQHDIKNLSCLHVLHLVFQSMLDATQAVVVETL